jgi:hypothetical protein
MADEIRAATYAKFVKGSKNVKWDFGTFEKDVSGTDYQRGTQIANDTTTSPNGVALDKGNVGTLGLFVARNNDVTTSINILTAVSGTVIVTLAPQEQCMFTFGSGVTAPAIRSSSSTLTAELEYLLIEA